MHNSYLSLILLLLSSIHSIFGFNLEARIPVVKRGSPGSYFGYSVAEHQEVSDNADKKLTSWMLIGAPLGQNLQPKTNRSGALWRCPLSTNESDCVQVVTDGIKADSPSYSNVESKNLVAPDDTEIKDNQWLGVTVRSQGSGGKVMVCAHRYISKTTESRWGQGLCYILTQHFEYEDVRIPCSGRPTNKAHEQFGYCQAGTSGILTSEHRVVIGTPGPHTWKGNLFVFTIDDNYLERDSTIYYAPMQDASPVNKYSYLGMSVTAGNYFGENLSYAAGAPHSNGTGQVVLLSRLEQDPTMKVDLILDGEQFASSYGYEITTADVNGDKIGDLIVAAPFYFKKSEGGSVYVYTKLCKNGTEKLDPKCNKYVKLVGHEESRFGFALTNLGDLNKDGYEDIAIGAPYEDRGAIYIYLGSKDGIITSPAQVIHSNQLPTSLSTFGYSLSGGMDLDQNGYPDLLVGAYDDDAVVLLRSRKIIDITTYIRYQNKNLTYQEKIAPIDPNKVGCPADPTSNYTCFSFEACCKTESLVKDKDLQNLILNYSIEAETYSGSRKFSRVWFQNVTLRPNSINRIVTLDPKKSEHCQVDTVYLKENTRDIQSPIKFRFNYTLIQEEPIMPAEGEPLPDITNFPILNQQEAARIFEATFQKECGTNEICESDVRLDAKLNLTESKDQPKFYELLLGEKEEVVVDVDADNYGESAYEAQLFIVHSPSLSYIASKSNDSVICNLYNTTLVTCAIGNPFKMNQSVSIQVRFDPKGLEDSESQIEFVVFVNSTSEERTEKKPIILQATVSKKAELSIKGSTKTQWVFYGGPIVGESAVRHLHEVGPKVSHTYEIFNEGPWKVSSLEVLISWPYEVANNKPHGKWLLYLEELPIVQALGGGECSLPPGHSANPLKLQGSSNLEDLDSIFPSTTTVPQDNRYMNQTANHIRERRDTEQVVITNTTIDKDGNRHQVVAMNCKSNTAKCFVITCVIYNLQRQKGAAIVVKARLWNSTLVEDYPRVDMVKIGSHARIQIPSKLVIQQENLNDDIGSIETAAYPDLLDQGDAEYVPIWIIIVAIVAGLLLLVLLTLVLWKLGFFKRRRPDPTLSGNLEKHRDDNPENEALFKH